MARPDLLLIINPLSGTASLPAKQRLVVDLQKLAAREGFTPEAVFTERPGHATELARTAVEAGLGRVIAIGGDGTLNETANALLHTRTALGMVPVGSGNGLARHLGIPLSPRQAAARAVSGRPVVIDSGRINELPFFCTAGVGFDAHVAHLFARQPTRGLPSYIRTAFGAFQTYRPQTYRIDGQPHTLFSLTVANAGQFGNNAWIAPQANIADGQLDLCALQPFPKQAAGILAWRLFRKTLHQSPYLQTQRFRSVTISGEGPLSIHIDGEPVELLTDTMRVQVVPNSLLVIL